MCEDIKYEVVIRENIFNAEMPYEFCHASTITRLPNGDLLSAWFAGSKEGADDVAIWCSRRNSGKWSTPFKLTDENGIPHWNPVLLTTSDGKILLFYKVGRKISEWYTKIKVSVDKGFTWSDSAELVPGDRGGRGPVRNKVVVLSNGSWLAPASMENGIWSAFADISTDEGKSWFKSNDIYVQGLDYPGIEVVESDIPVSRQSFFGRGVIQPTLWESEPGLVHMLLRSTEGRIYRSDSSDWGKSWSNAYPTELPNNNSGIDAVKIKDGPLVLAYNPVGINWGPRTPIALNSSMDNGKTWCGEYILDGGEGEYSYPAIIFSGKDIYVTYTRKRKTISFWKIALSF